MHSSILPGPVPMARGKSPLHVFEKMGNPTKKIEKKKNPSKV